MSRYFAENGERYIPTFEDGRTKQAFKDQCDINKMLKSAQKTGSIAHLQKYPELVYGEFSGVDLLGAYEQLERANQIFADLPSEVRNEFDNNAIKFVEFAGNPENNSRLAELLPAIAEPGAYFPNPVERFGQGAGAATAPAEVVPEAPGAPVPADPQAAGDGSDTS